MQHENLFQRIQEIKHELDRMLDEEPNPIEPKVNPRFLELLAEGIAVQKELDILMRGTFRKPEELAWWEKKMQLCREADAEGFLEELRAQAESQNQSGEKPTPEK